MENEEKVEILIVDDRPENLLVMKQMLAELDQLVLTASSGREALRLLLKHEVAVVLMDVQMPGMDGFETAELMRSRERTRHVPIIFITAVSREQKYIFRGYEKGAVDYLLTPYDPVVVRSKVRVFCDLCLQSKRLQGAVEESQRALAQVRRSEERLKTALREKEILLREIHHRTKNNMQIIISLLRLKARTTESKAVLAALADSENRIRAMALIHETLYRSVNVARITVKSYVERLAELLVEALWGKAKPAGRLTVDAVDLTLDIDDAVPLGLIINELVSNAALHAFPEGEAGEIVVQVSRFGEDELRLMVRDNGSGIPEEINARSAKTLGLRLVARLAEDQLRGRVEISRDGGTTVTVTFKKRPASASEITS